MSEQTRPRPASADKVVLLVELAGGEIVAVPFDSRERAEWWEERMPYEVVGRPRVVSAKSLAVGAAIRARRSQQ